MMVQVWCDSSGENENINFLFENVALKEIVERTITLYKATTTFMD